MFVGLLKSHCSQNQNNLNRYVCSLPVTQLIYMIYLFLLNHLIQEAVDEGIRFQCTSIRYH